MSEDVWYNAETDAFFLVGQSGYHKGLFMLLLEIYWDGAGRPNPITFIGEL